MSRTGSPLSPVGEDRQGLATSKSWIAGQYPGLELTPNSLVWGNPEKGLNERFPLSRDVAEVRDPIKNQFQGTGCQTSHTRYSLPFNLY